MADQPISIGSDGNPSPDTLDCDAGDKITWTNNYTKEVTSFSLPSCVSPQDNPAPIAVGATTRKFTVNNGANGDYGYEYDFPSATRSPRTGTIDVGDK